MGDDRIPRARREVRPPPLRRTALIAVDADIARLVERRVRLLELEPFHVAHWSEAVEHLWEVDTQRGRRHLQFTVLDLRSRADARLAGYTRFMHDYALLAHAHEQRTFVLCCAPDPASLREVGPCAATIILDPGSPQDWAAALDRILAYTAAGIAPPGPVEGAGTPSFPKLSTTARR